MPKLKSFSITTLEKKKFDTLEGLSNEWINTIGDVQSNLTMTIAGDSGHGKTTFALQLVKMLVEHGKVYYNSVEQGFSKSLQSGIEHAGLTSIEPKYKNRVVFGDRDDFETMMEKLLTNKAKFVFIDSVQYMNMTYHQYKRLIKTHPKKGFILISQLSGDKPKGAYAQDIEYAVDVKGYVKNGEFTCRSRFGQTEPFMAIPNFKTKSKNNFSQLTLNFK